jgi:hypothetical protein
MVRAERFLTEARRFSLLHSMPEHQGQLLTEKARAKRGPGGCLAGSACVFRRRSRRRSANHKLLSSLHLDGRYRIRTCDPLRVKQALSQLGSLLNLSWRKPRPGCGHTSRPQKTCRAGWRALFGERIWEGELPWRISGGTERSYLS